MNQQLNSFHQCSLALTNIEQHFFKLPNLQFIGLEKYIRWREILETYSNSKVSTVIMKQWSTSQYRKAVLAPPYRGRGHRVFVPLYSTQNHSDLQCSNVFRGFRYKVDEACCRRVSFCNFRTIVFRIPRSSFSRILSWESLALVLLEVISSESSESVPSEPCL